MRSSAEELGLKFDEAVALAREFRLPKTPLGNDLQGWIWMLYYEPDREVVTR